MKDKPLLTPSAAPSSFSFTTMGVRILIAAHMVLLAATSCTKEEKGVWLYKCCNVHQMLSADGESCENARWPRNFTIKRGKIFWEIVSPLDSEWVRRWLPPGLPMENISAVFTELRNIGEIVSPVNASTFWDPALLAEDLSNNTVAFLGERYIARPSPGGGLRKAGYCVDAAPPPLGPFAIRVRTLCSEKECANKCCKTGKLLKKDDKGRWRCEIDDGAFWKPHKSSLKGFDSEFPYGYFTLCENPRLSTFEERYTEWARYSASIHQFHFSTWTICFDSYSTGNGSSYEGVFSCEYPRITRGVYWLLRPLCFVSALLLTASLLSVACDNSMRRKTHGRCLACHAACLWAFNIGQTVYFLAMSDNLDEQGKREIPTDLQTICKNFALLMYFVLTASWFWLTTLCANMARGFSLHIPRRNKGNGKRFLAISAVAWGLPAVLTTTCSIFFTQPKYRETPAWYTPSFMETRTCYIEPFYNDRKLSDMGEAVPFMKSGTALFYYGPVFCLVLSNIVCLVVTLRKVQYLKRGNSVLRREEDQIPLDQRHTEGNNPPTAHAPTGNEQSPQGRNRRGTAVDAKTIKLYTKMVLLSGGIELLTEVIMWFTTHDTFTIVFASSATYSSKDKDLAYRAAGYVTDFFRAAVVTWLAAPEGGYLALIMGMLRRDKKGKKSPGAGNAGRRKQNVA